MRQNIRVEAMRLDLHGQEGGQRLLQRRGVRSHSDERDVVQMLDETGHYPVLLQTLLASPKIRLHSLDGCPTQQGVYVLWLDGVQGPCLKVGKAGPRRGKGLRGRLELHCKSQLGNSVLARHLESDTVFARTQGFDFRSRADRMRFLADHCYAKALPLPGFSETWLLDLEKFVADRLNPRYRGRTGQYE